ncbi:MAG TPA: M24 family metallopeptidase [Chryseosolibacter sp.]
MRYFLFVLLLIVSCHSFGQPYSVLTQKDQSQIIDGILEDRLKTLLPELMRREKIDCWVIISREYNEDPIIETLLPATWMAARRTTMLVVFDQGADKDLELLAISRYDVGKLFKRSWDPEAEPDQWNQLSKVLQERNPKKIAVNKSEHEGIADGISATELEKLKESLPENLRGKVVSAEPLGVAWLETRTEKEMEHFQKMCRISHDIIKEGFSSKVITPGRTTTDDVTWWFREKIKELKLDTWFHPSVSIQRSEPDVLFLKRPQPVVIQPGDLLHVDFGISYLRLNTDIQQHAYVLKEGETSAPKFLKDALAKGNQLQDILTGNFRQGKSGNEILAESRKEAIAAGLVPSIYTHPIGYHGHAAGTTIGMWDMQGGVPHDGDYPLHYNTAYSIELNTTVYLQDWKKEILIKLEEDGYFDQAGFRYIDGRQTDLIVIPSKAK